MNVIVPGHKYELHHFEPSEGHEALTFIRKELMDLDGNGEKKFITVENGTTNEEVLRVLIDRIQSLNQKAPCRENSIVITKLEEALMWLEKRTAERKSRGVEGTPLK